MEAWPQDGGDRATIRSGLPPPACPETAGAAFDTPVGAGASWTVISHVPIHLLVAQAMVEHGMLDAMASGIAAARSRIELYIGEGNSLPLLIVLLLVLALLFRRRR